MQPQNIYYVSRSGQQFGPYTAEQLTQSVAEHRFLNSDLGWRAGIAEWVPLSHLMTLDAISLPVPAEKRMSAGLGQSNGPYPFRRQMMFSRPLIITLFALLVVGAGVLVYFKETSSSRYNLLSKLHHASLSKSILVGTWDDILDSQSLDFKPDGTVIMTVKDTPVPGEYTLDETDSVLFITVKKHDIHFRWEDDRLIISESNVPTDVFSKRPNEADLLTVPCNLVVSGVLSDRGNRNYQMSQPELSSKDPNLTIMLLPGARWTHKDKKEAPPDTECIGYTRSIDDTVKDIQLRGRDAPVVSNHHEALFAVYEVRQ